MILYKDAKKILIQMGGQHSLKIECVDIKQAVGRICAKNVDAPIDIQPFDNSAMDGYVVRRCDLQTTGGVLIRSGVVAAGDPVPDEALQVGQCMEIMTGAPIPPHGDAVVPIELLEVQGNQIKFSSQPKPYQHIRKAGEDFQKGMEVLSVGEMIHPQHIMPLATLGISTVEVYKKPRAVFLATGNELVEDLSQDLKSGQIYNSNRPYGEAAMLAMGIECISVPTMPDDSDQFASFLKDIESQEIDFIISSGAVSAGKFDFIRQGLETAGAEILFHKVKIKPGKPNLFARLPNGTLYFGLPGNPVSTTAGLRFFVQPCLRSMMGMEEEQPVRAQAMNSFQKRAGVRVFLKARAVSQEDGVLGFSFLEGQNSFMVRPFLNMNCWAAISEDTEEIKVGDIVDLYPLYPHSGVL